jgi:hypothetical protein
VIPKPPFGSDLTLERELDAFVRLKPPLSTLWNALSAREEDPYTSVVIPSMTLDGAELSKLEAASFYERPRPGDGLSRLRESSRSHRAAGPTSTDSIEIDPPSTPSTGNVTASSL